MEQANTETAQRLTLTLAAKAAAVSEVTLRKHLKAGRLEASRVQGRYGSTWAIDVETLAAFVLGRYGHGLSSTHHTETPSAQGSASIETAGDLRRRLEEALQELGKYRALVAAGESAAADVERLLKERLAEIRAERDVAQAELDRMRARGFWGRLFGGSTG